MFARTDAELLVFISPLFVDLSLDKLHNVDGIERLKSKSFYVTNSSSKGDARVKCSLRCNSFKTRKPLFRSFSEVSWKKVQQIQSFSILYFTVFGLNMENDELLIVNICIQSKYENVQNQKTPCWYIFHTISFGPFPNWWQFYSIFSRV